MFTIPAIDIPELDLTVEPGAYIATTVNEYGERLIYVHDRNGSVLYHSDYDYKPVEAYITFANRTPVIGGKLIVHASEALWVATQRELSGANVNSKGKHREGALIYDAMTAFGIADELARMLKNR